MKVPQTPVKFLHRASFLYGRKVGIVDGPKRFTYAEYHGRVNRLSNALLARGVGKGDRVAYLGFNTHWLLEAYYGVVQIGAILVPLNIRLTSADFNYIINHCEARMLILEKELLGLIEPIRHDLRTVSDFVMLDTQPVTDAGWLDYEAMLAAAASHQPPDAGIDEDDVAEIFYTSGTTGKPKGVMLTHRNLYANAFSYITGVNVQDSDVQLHTIPLFHVNGWGTPHALTAVGGVHVMLKAFRPDQVFQLIQDERVTIAAMVPTMVNALLNYPNWSQYDLSSFRRVVVGGAASPPALAKAVRDKFGWEYIVGYGLSETSPILTIANLKDYMRSWPPEEQFRRQTMTGIPVIGVELKVVDNHGSEVPRDGQSIGEIVVRGDMVMKGYWKDPEETARVIVDGWFHTGDMAIWDEEGYVMIVDRKKDIIISGGENISSVEVENVLYQHPGVLEAAVIAVPDQYWGEVPHAIVVPKPGLQITAEEILEHCRRHLASFKVPKSVEFVEALPKTGTGKILKAMLREKYWKKQ
jgi:fatty-acyl-CoA synthase